MDRQLRLVAATREADAGGLERRQTTERGEEIGAQPDDLIAAGGRPRSAVRAPAGLGLHRELTVALVDALAKALAANGGGRPDDRRTRRHVPAIILPHAPYTRLFMTGGT